MTQAQVLAAVRWLLTLAGPSIIATGWVSGNMWEQFLSLTPSLVGLVWSMFVHTDSAVVTAAAAVPGAKVQIDPLAAPALVAMANDRSITNVVPAPIATASPDTRRF